MSVDSMSGGEVNLQAQVESVLGALLKAATVELTRLFESRYRASAGQLGRTENTTGPNQTVETLGCLASADSKLLRSVGVQVDEDIYSPLELSAPLFLSDGDCLKECREEEEEEEEEEEGDEEEEEEGDPIPADFLLVEDDDHVDPEWSLITENISGRAEGFKSQVEAERIHPAEKDVALLEESSLEAFECPTITEPKTEVVVPDVKPGSSQSSPVKQKPLLIQPEKSDVTAGSQVKFVCPLILKAEFPAPEPVRLEEPVQVEPQHASVGTAEGKAYSPSPSDGAAAPPLVRVWERIHTATETENHLQLKLKLSSPDPKLMRPCAVQLVNLSTVPEAGATLATDADKGHCADRKTGWPLPKDLRHHQGLHTGHRLCCFTRCGNGVWRLQRVVAHSRGGYACSICAKKFKRRKILRRHERFHTGERPYACAHCSKTFALRKSLRRHERFHTGERPHTCTHCGKSFRLRDNLKAHLRFHTGEKPFNCTICGKSYRILRNLEKHNLTQCGIFVPSFRKIAGL
ncbi:uncharacterized protein [Centroberyx affinis]|uniref:uncharacterized protein n=1 Tax=Centroberyx affinis TaxID=166261 RepID=UPI003A5C61FC